MKYTEAILSSSTRKLLWFEIAKTLIAVEKITMLFIIMFVTLSLRSHATRRRHHRMFHIMKTIVVSERCWYGVDVAWLVAYCVKGEGRCVST